MRMPFFFSSSFFFFSFFGAGRGGVGGVGGPVLHTIQSEEVIILGRDHVLSLSSAANDQLIIIRPSPRN